MARDSSGEKMSAVDRAWLDMDDPLNPMVINAVFQLEGPVDAAHFQRSVIERLLRFPRFRQRVDITQASPAWVEDSAPDFSYHLQVRRLPKETHERELLKAIASEISRDIDRMRPLWRVILYPSAAGGPVTVLFRAHHAVADGMALVTLLIDSTDAGLQRAPQPSSQSAAEREPTPGPLGGLIDQLKILNVELDRLSTRAGVRLPRSPAWRARVRESRETLASVRRVLSLPPDKPPVFDRPLSGQRSVAWLSDFPLAPIRILAAALDVRMNDVLMSALAGAFARELRGVDGALPEAANLRVSVPVNLRSGRGRELGNQFGLVLLELPVGIRDPLLRLEAVVSRMNELKNSPEAKATLMSLATASHLPMPLEKKLVRMIGAKSNAVVSSLPGPKRHVSIAGARMKNLVFWPPQAGGIGIGISFFTYANQISFGVSADRSLMPNPRNLIVAFNEEIDLLRERAQTGAGAQGTSGEPVSDSVVVPHRRRKASR